MALRRFVEDYQVMSGDDPGTEPQSGRWRLIDDMDERWIQVREVVIDDWRFEPTDQWGGPPIVEALHRTAKAHRIEAEAFRASGELEEPLWNRPLVDEKHLISLLTLLERFQEMKAISPNAT